MPRLYFGYGSNLSESDWHTFCREESLDPSCLERVEPAWLPDRQLAFTRASINRNGGVLDVRPAMGCVASGWLFRADARGWRALDKKEGANGISPAYKRIECIVHRADGRPVEAETYEVNPEQRHDFVAPSANYLSICHDARTQLGLDTANLEEASRGEPPAPLDMLFVYGTLLPGQSRHGFLAAAGVADIQLGSVAGRLVDHGTFPGLIAGVAGSVQGMLVRMPDAVSLLRVLDQVEGFIGHGHRDNLFVRASVDVRMKDDATIRAWTYLGTDPTLPTIAGGCWRSHVAVVA